MSLDRNAIGSLGFEEYLQLIEDRYADANAPLEIPQVKNRRLQVNHSDVDDAKSTRRRSPQGRKQSAAPARNINSRQTEPAAENRIR